MRRVHPEDSRDEFNRRWGQRGRLTRVEQERRVRECCSLGDGFLLDGHWEYLSDRDNGHTNQFLNFTNELCQSPHLDGPLCLET